MPRVHRIVYLIEPFLLRWVGHGGHPQRRGEKDREGGGVDRCSIECITSANLIGVASGGSKGPLRDLARLRQRNRVIVEERVRAQAPRYAARVVRVGAVGCGFEKIGGSGFRGVIALRSRHDEVGEQSRVRAVVRLQASDYGLYFCNDAPPNRVAGCPLKRAKVVEDEV